MSYRSVHDPVDDYGWRNLTPPHSCDYIAPRIISLVERLNVRRVCDVGCGNAALLVALKSRGFDVVGLEIDKNVYNLVKNAYKDIKFYNHGVQESPNLLMESEDVFDCVVSTEVIEHLYSPHLLPVYAHSVLKVGGFLVISTPYHGYIKNFLLSVFNKWDTHFTALWHGGHIKFWSKNTLTHLLQENGFRVIGFHGVGRLPYLWKSMILICIKE